MDYRSENNNYMIYIYLDIKKCRNVIEYYTTGLLVNKSQ